MEKPADVDAYLAQFEGVARERLDRLRETVRRIAPDAVESIAYAMPAYKLHGKPLVYFAGYDKHVGVYATPSGQAAFAEQLADYKQGKGSVQFPHDRAMPWELIEGMIRFRADELSG